MHFLFLSVFSKHSSKPPLPPLPPIPAQRSAGRINVIDSNSADYTEPYSPPGQEITLPRYLNHGPKKRQLPPNPVSPMNVCVCVWHYVYVHVLGACICTCICTCIRYMYMYMY